MFKFNDKINQDQRLKCLIDENLLKLTDIKYFPLNSSENQLFYHILSSISQSNVIFFYSYSFYLSFKSFIISNQPCVKSPSSIAFIIYINNYELNTLYYSHRWFSRKLFYFLNLNLALISLNAYISTLGGGYFLIRKICVSEYLAYQQMKIAKRLGNRKLMSECYIHLIYNLICKGKLNRAYKLIYKLKRNKVHSQIAPMLLAAETYIQKIRDIKHKLIRNKQQAKNTNHVHPAKLTHSELARQLFI